MALTAGALWWWAVLRLVLAPGASGAVEGAVAVGGWGLGLLPVHCVPAPLRRARRSGGRDGGDAAAGAGPATTASILRRSDAGSGP
ncbi:hypothetical protein AW27_008360 [Streptomyces sp. PCS3-D2]|nr:hypothetical protein [Streptomyces sp. PCS3-D2]WKV76132.1 hypothetical protein AW27_008360 [Streptomyces sp. PCS3-D2]